MKYIKKFEEVNYNIKYKVGDYILIDKECNLNLKRIDMYKNYGIIVSREFEYEDDDKRTGRFYYYKVNYIDSNDFKVKNIDIINLTNYHIIRVLTSDEIKDFNLTLTANKFNL